MKEITEKNLINVIKEKFPEFIPYWETYTNYWGSDEGIILQMMPLTNYVVDVIKSEDNNVIKEVFYFIEFLICNGNDLVSTALTTGFLEALVNKDPEEIQFIKFSQYLGKETIGYLRAWNEFCGVHTEGIN